jgi:hypothetical protein
MMKEFEYRLNLLVQRVEEICLELDALRQLIQPMPTDQSIVKIPHNQGVSDAEL